MLTSGTARIWLVGRPRAASFEMTCVANEDTPTVSTVSQKTRKRCGNRTENSSGPTLLASSMSSLVSRAVLIRPT